MVRFARRRDWILVILIAAGALGAVILPRYFYEKNPCRARAVFYADGVPVRELELVPGATSRFSLPGHEEVVFRQYEDGSVAFESSDCPEHLCVHAGRLSVPGQFAACLPNRLVLVIEAAPGEEAEVDAVAR